MCYAVYGGIGETCWCWDATPKSNSWVMKSADVINIEHWSSGVHVLNSVVSTNGVFSYDVSSMSRLVVWRCLAGPVLASSSAGRCDVPWCDVMAADLCWTLFVADCYCGAGDGELLACLLWCIRLFGLELWSILDVVNSRNSVKFRSYVLLVVLALVYSGLDFSRC